MSKIVVYSAIFGKFNDKVRQPQNWPTDGSCQLVMFTDQLAPGRKGHWEIRKTAFPGYKYNGRRNARQHKLLPHRIFPEAEWWLWVDGCLAPKIDPREIVKNHKKYSLATFKHMERSCVYEELAACIRLKKDDPKLMKKQVNRYRELGYPPWNGLGETTAVLRRNKPKIIQFNELWWKEMEEGSLRDQLGFDYSAWKLKIDYGHLAGKRTASPYFTYRAHR